MRAGRGNDATLPWRARGAACVRIRRCLPYGQRRFRVARWILGVSRERVVCEAVCPSGKFPGAPENGERADGPLHAGEGDTRRLADGTSPSSWQPQPHHSPVANAALYKARLIACVFRGENIRRVRRRPAFRARKRQCPTFPATASSPRPSRGENGGLCPHPLKGPG